jgi:FkbM family methyltransferase
MINRAFKKHALPVAAHIFAVPGLRQLPPVLENIGAALQSKRGGGYAATWQETQGALNFISTPTPTVFDIGANLGHWSAAFLKLLPTTQQLVMFEPQPACWPALEKLCGNGVKLDRHVVSEATGEQTFWINPNSEISSLYERAGGGPGSQRVTTSTTTIDEFIARNRIETVDYMKIDVEGHELQVIKGAR